MVEGTGSIQRGGDGKVENFLVKSRVEKKKENWSREKIGVTSEYCQCVDLHR